MISDIGLTLAQCTAADTSISNVGPIYRMLAMMYYIIFYTSTKYKTPAQYTCIILLLQQH